MEKYYSQTLVQIKSGGVEYQKNTHSYTLNNCIKRVNPLELTKVSDWGERTKTQYMQLEV